MTPLPWPVYAFSGGEITPRLDGRADLDLYGRSVRRMRNMAALPHGPAMRRPPTWWAAEVKDSADAGLLIPFVVGRAAAYVVELGDQYARFYTGDGRLESSGSPVEVATPWAAADLAGLSWVQSWDVMWLVHADYQPRVLSRTSATAFALAVFDQQDGPWLPINTTATTLALSGTSGSVTVTASAATGINGGSGFQTTDVGRLIRWHDGSDYHWLTITAHSSTTQVTADVENGPTGGTTGTTLWRLGFWSGTDGWPSAVGLFQQRLWFGAAAGQLNRFDASKSADFEVFTPGSGDNDPLSFTADTDGVVAPRWFQGRRSVLLAGCDGAELTISSGSAGPVAPAEILVDEQTAHGSAAIKPARLADRVLFVQARGRKLRELRFREADGWQAPDVSRHADHLLQAGLVQLAWQEEPWGILWACDADGLLLGLTYDPDGGVLAWHAHPIGGDGIVESVACIPGTGKDDRLWLLVRRTIDGQTRRYVERLGDWPDDDADQADLAHVDSAISYSGSATDLLTGAAHLEGETVQILAGDAVHPDVTVAGGQVQLDREVTAAILGLAAPARLKLNRPQLALRLGSSEGRKRRVNKLWVRLLRSAGLLAGPTEAGLTAVPERGIEDGLGEAVALFSGLVEVPFEGELDIEGDIWLGADGPRPLTVLCLTADVDVTAETG